MGALEAELVSAATGNPAVTWRLHNCGSLLCAGKLELASVSLLYDVTVGTIAAELGQKMDKVAERTSELLLERQCFDWEVDCSITSHQNLYDEEDLSDESFPGEGFRRDRLMQEKEVHCTKKAGSVRFTTAKKRAWMTVLVKNSNSAAKELSVDLRSCYGYREATSSGSKSARVELVPTAWVHTEGWCPQSLASGRLVLTLEFDNVEAKKLFLLMIRGWSDVAARQRRIWAFAQELRPHLGESARGKMDAIGKILSLETWDELLKRPVTTPRKQTRATSCEEGLPKGVTLVPKTGSISQPLTEKTRLSQLIPHMFGDGVSEFELDLTLIIATLTPHAHEPKWR